MLLREDPREKVVDIVSIVVVGSLYSIGVFLVAGGAFVIGSAVNDFLLRKLH